MKKNLERKQKLEQKKFLLYLKKDIKKLQFIINNYEKINKKIL